MPKPLSSRILAVSQRLSCRAGGRATELNFTHTGILGNKKRV